MEQRQVNVIFQLKHSNLEHVTETFYVEKKKSTNRPQLNRVWRPEAGEMMIAESKRKEKDFSSFLARTQSMKTRTLSFL